MKYSYSENKNKIKEISELKTGWYDKTSQPICKKALNNLEKIVDKLHDNHLTQPFIVPWAGGVGCQLEYEYGNIYLEINFCEEDTFSFLFSSCYGSKENTEFISGHLESLNDVHNAIVQLLKYLRL